MKKYFFFIVVNFFVVALVAQPTKNTGKYILVIHGGAGTILKSNMTPEKEKMYKQGLQNALNAGSDILKKAALH